MYYIEINKTIREEIKTVYMQKKKVKKQDDYKLLILNSRENDKEIINIIY